MERSAKMAAAIANESVYEDCHNYNNLVALVDEDQEALVDHEDTHLELYETALEDYFADLNLDSTQELHELSRITNGDRGHRENLDRSPSMHDDDRSPSLPDDDDAAFYLAVKTMALTSTMEPRRQPKNFIDSTSSTPKRKLQFAKPPRHVKMIAQLAELAEESLEQEKCSGVATASSCGQESSSSSKVASLDDKHLEMATSVDLVNLSLLVREHRRELILSPLSQKLKSAILRQERLQKRQQRIELSKKSQRVSLRV